ncbi:MAG: glycosyltransferase family 4 protein [Planctomycetes bacterium]|nr:glycosyltransferase family 4 protein [Planctomycetota bacterium]
MNLTHLYNLERRPIRILLVTRPGIGGAAVHVEMLARHIDPARFDLRCVVSPLEDLAYLNRFIAIGDESGGPDPGVTGRLIRALDAGGKRISVVPVPILRQISPRADWQAFQTIRAVIRDWPPDICHFHTSKPGFLGRLAAWVECPQAARVYTPHGLFYEYHSGGGRRIFYRELERAMGPLTDALVCVSPNEAEAVRRANLMDPARIVCIPNAVDTERRPSRPALETRLALGLSPEAPVVLMVGRLTPPKDPLAFIDAASRVQAVLPTAEFLLVGDGELRGEVERRCTRSLSVRVRRLGHRQDLPDLYSIADVFVLSTRFEGLPLTLLESLAAGVPAVASDVPGCRDVVREGVNGHLVPPGDAAAMATRILDRLGDREGSRRMGAAGRERVRAEFGLKPWMAAVERLYRRMAGRP